MADPLLLDKVVINWRGFPSAPGSTTFYGSGLAGHLPAIASFFDAIKSLFNNEVAWDFPTAGYTLNEFTGIADTTWSHAAITPFGGTGGSAAMAAPAGSNVTWKTAGLNNRGHLIKGRSFLVPLSVASYTNDGHLSSSAQTTISTAAAALITACAGALMIYRLPYDGTPPRTPPESPYVGQAAAVTSAVVPTTVSVLRSRR